MDLNHEFTVAASAEDAWALLRDIPRAATCVPGLTLDAVADGELTGRLKVRLGSTSITYRFTADITEVDEREYVITAAASGEEARGPGAAEATLQACVRGTDEGQALVQLHARVTATGRAAELDRDLLSAAGTRIASRFAEAFSGKLPSPDRQPRTVRQQPTAPAEQSTTTSEPASAPTERSSTGPEPAAMSARPNALPAEAGRLTLAKRLAPLAAAGLVVAVGVRRLLRRRRRRR